MENIKIENVEIARIHANKTQPRKHFDPAQMEELTSSVREKGILQPLLARPSWCIGTSDADIAKMNGSAPAAPEFYEIVAGERRFRAGQAAQLTTLPLIVRVLSDRETLEIALIENLQRADLNPVEEAEGYRQLLAMRDAAGNPIYTVELIHQKTGKTTRTIYGKLKLLSAPKSVLKALEKGVIGARLAELIGRIPAPEMRETAAKEILSPQYREGPLSYRAAEQLVHEEFMRSLASAPFDQKDSILVPVMRDELEQRIGGGACVDCPMRTGNSPELMGEVKRPDICTNPKCYAAKVDAALVRLRETAAAEGKKLLSQEEAEDIFDEDGSISWSSEYVDISKQPERSDVKPGTKNIPSWKRLIENSPGQPEVLLAVDPKGKVREVIKRDLAIAAHSMAAKAKGEASIFVATGGRGSSTSSNGGLSQDEKRKRELKKQEFAVTLACLESLSVAIDKNETPQGFWDALMYVAACHAGHDGCWIICKRLELDPKAKNLHSKEEGVRGAALEYGLTLPDEEKLGFIVELLVSKQVRFYGAPENEDFGRFASLYKLDVGAIDRRVRLESKEKAAAKGRAKPDGKIVWERLPKAKYNFNSNGVCDDESILRLPFAKTTNVKVDIRVAIAGKKWVTGYDASWGAPTADGSGGMSALPAKDGEAYSTLREALVSEAEDLYKHLKSSLSKPVLKLLEAHIAELKTMPLTDPLAEPSGAKGQSDVKAPATGTIEHKWEKRCGNLFECTRCGAEGTQIGLSWPPVPEDKFLEKPCVEKPNEKKTRRKPTPETKAKISEGRKRGTAVKSTKGGLSAFKRRKLAQMMKARWAARRRNGGAK